VKAVVATRNAHKLREIEALMKGLGWVLVSIDAIAPNAVLAEEEDTFAANALAKARQARAATGLPAIADDSGIEVDALDGAPGVRSARYAGEPCDDRRNNEKLIAAMRGVKGRTARYRCAAAFVDGERELVTDGACEGVLLEAARGRGGFGYDPLFLLPDRGLTMAEISDADKNGLSHRAAAFKALAAALTE
jgi:XTP/dITP diphosphohydrolase